MMESQESLPSAKSPTESSHSTTDNSRSADLLSSTADATSGSKLDDEEDAQENEAGDQMSEYEQEQMEEDGLSANLVASVDSAVDGSSPYRGPSRRGPGRPRKGTRKWPRAKIHGHAKKPTIDVYGVNESALQEAVQHANNKEAADAFSASIRDWHVKVKERRAANYAPLKTVVFAGEEMTATRPRPTYPQDVVQQARLFICHGCFEYFKEPHFFAGHYAKCPNDHPPGDEVYRATDRNVSIFHIHESQKVYCRLLSMFAMLWIHDKIAYGELVDFDFYVVTQWDAERGFVPVGYCSRPRFSVNGVNLCCFAVFPAFQRLGYGRFIIEFSYFVGKLEGAAGFGPERPFSGDGEKTYNSFWRASIIRLLGSALKDKKTKISCTEIVCETGIGWLDLLGAIPKDICWILSNVRRGDVFVSVKTSKLEEADREEQEKQNGRLSIRRDLFSPKYITAVEALAAYRGEITCPFNRNLIIKWT